MKEYYDSQQLSEIRKLLEQFPQIQELLPAVFNLRVVIDTNIVIGDLLWLTTKRKNNSSQTAVIESIKAGTLTAYAPTHLKEEVQNKLPFVAEKRNADLIEMETEWQSYQEHLVFIEVPKERINRDGTTVDPDDLPFQVLSEILGGIGVLTKDHDLHEMGANVINLDIRILRDYSRSATVYFQLTISGYAFSGLTLGMLFLILKIIANAVKGLTNLPPRNLLLLTAIVAGVFIHPASRKYITDTIKEGSSSLAGYLKTFEPTINDAYKEAMQHKSIAEEKLSDIHSSIKNEARS